jgi:drug/metabolite transporter (DMT)-like permease
VAEISPTAAQRRSADNVALAIGLVLAAVMIFGVQDAISKLLVQTYAPFQIAMMRFWAFAVFSLVLVSRQAPIRHAFRSRHPWLQTLRGILLVIDIWFFAAALKTVPLAEIQAITLVYPLLATLAAIPILGEKVGLFRFGAVAVGFGGALVIVRPGGLPLDWGVLFAVLSAIAYSLYLVLTRKVSASDTTATSMVYVGVGGLVLTTLVGIPFWTPMAAGDLLLIGAVMTTSVAAHLLMMVALSRAPASVLQPFNYISLPWGIVLSYTVFGHLIDTVSLMGGAVIVGAGLVVMGRERALLKRRRDAARQVPP